MLSIFDGLREVTFLSVSTRMLLAVVCGGVLFHVEGWRLAVYFLFSIFAENLLEGGIITVNTETAAALNIDYTVFQDMGTVAEVQTTED